MTPGASRTALIAATALAVAAAAGLGVLWLRQAAPDRFADCGGGAAGATIGGPFTLTDENGRTVTDAEVLAQPSLVYFGYTFCPDVCPTDNARNAEAVDLLEARGLTVQPVFISIDPERDTPERLRDFTDMLHPRMLGLTGTPEQVAAASRAYRTYFRKVDSGDEYYLVDHSTQTYLMLPGYGFVTFFPRDATAEAMADSTACYLAHA
ncbi:MAG: SCO family protein [Rhodobacteraceae bacterium]|nr:SCO family protein [Paracoccaceae bacterium]